MKALMTFAMMLMMTVTAQANPKEDPALTKTFDLIQVQREEKAAYRAFLKSLGENPDDRGLAMDRMEMDEDNSEMQIVLKPQS